MTRLQQLSNKITIQRDPPASNHLGISYERHGRKVSGRWPQHRKLYGYGLSKGNTTPKIAR